LCPKREGRQKAEVVGESRKDREAPRLKSLESRKDREVGRPKRPEGMKVGGLNMPEGMEVGRLKMPEGMEVGRLKGPEGAEVGRLKGSEGHKGMEAERLKRPVGKGRGANIRFTGTSNQKNLWQRNKVQLRKEWSRSNPWVWLSFIRHSIMLS
jgi:hypothetical protein